MMFLKGLVLALAGLSAVAEAHLSARGFKLSKRDSILEVTLAPSLSGKTAELVATIKNQGLSDVNLLKFGTILDAKLPVQKVQVLSDVGVEIPFAGIHPSIQYDALQPQHFHLLKAGESVQATIDAASSHRFEQSGTYTFKAAGLIPSAAVESTELSGASLQFESNEVKLIVDAKEASASHDLLLAPLRARTNIQSGCNDTQLAATTTALEDCQKLSLAAAKDALDPSSQLFVEFFKSNSSETRKIVAERFTKVAGECSTTNSGVTRYFCYDYYGICNLDGPLNAYTLWDIDPIVMCDWFYHLPANPPQCQRQGRSATTIHEMTHSEGLYPPHTNDWSYGYNETVALSAERALANADSYALYSTSVYRNCLGGTELGNKSVNHFA